MTDLQRYRISTLTAQEAAVAGLLLLGLHTDRIGQVLGIRRNAASNTTTRIYNKLHVRSLHNHLRLKAFVMEYGDH